MTFDPVKGHMTYAGLVIDHCNQVSLKLTEEEESEEESERTIEKQNTGALHAPV